MTVRDYSTTAASNNAAPPNGWPEGQAASTVNDCGRQMMADIRESFEELPYFDYGDDPTRVDNDTFTVAGDLTARYPVGNRVKLVGATTGFGRITVSSHAAGTTTIDVVMDSGNVPTSLTRVAVGNTATPTGSIGLTATTGATGKYMDAGATPALSQAIAPTWTAQHTFSQVTNAAWAAVGSNSNAAGIRTFWGNTNAAVDNRYWGMRVNESGDLRFGTWSDANFPAASETGSVFSVDRTGTTVDRVAFPTDNNASAFSLGVAPATTGAMAHISTATASNAALTCKSTTAATGTVFVWNTATASDNVFIVFLTEGSSGTSRGSIDFNRAGTAVRYNTTSDGRLKRNVRGSSSAVDLVLSIPVDSFEWIERDIHVEHGFVAQKLYEVFPDAVSGGDREDGIMGIDRGALVPPLTKALQETILECQSLRSALTALTARVAALEGPAGIEVKPR